MGLVEVLGFAFAGLDSLLLHGQGSGYLWGHQEKLVRKKKNITLMNIELLPNSFFSHSYPMEFHVEATGVADRLPLCVSSPQGGGGGVTVGAGQAHPPGRRLPQTEHVSQQQGLSTM